MDRGFVIAGLGIYSIVSGGASIGITLFGTGRSSDRALLGLSGILSGLFGALVLTWPGISMISLLLAIIAYAFVNGIVHIVAAFEAHDGWIGLSGLVSVLFGMYAFRFPADGALTLLCIISLYAIFVGATLMASSIQIRNVGQALSPNMPAPQN